MFANFEYLTVTAPFVLRAECEGLWGKLAESCCPWYEGPMGVVEQIFVAGMRGAPMEGRAAVVVIADQGIVGDRYAIATNRRGWIIRSR